MKNIKTLSLLLTLTATNAFSANFDEFVEISNGHYAKLAADGTLTEIATTANAEVNLKKESSEESIELLSNMILAGVPYTRIDGLNMCTGVGMVNPQTFQWYEINQNGNTFTATGSANFGQGGTLSPPRPPYLESYVRIKTKLRAYDVNNVILDKNFEIVRSFSGAQNNLFLSGSSLWNNATSIATTLSITNPNIVKIRWTVKSNFMVDSPIALSGNTPGTEDCHETQTIKTSGTIQL